MASLHFILEVMSALLCFGIARLSYQRYAQIKNPFNLFWFLAFLLTGLMDSFHGLASYANNDLIANWVPGTWAAARTSLVALLLAAGIFAKTQISKKAVLGVSAAVATVSIGVMMPGLIDWSFVYASGWRILDAILIFPWIIAALLFRGSKATHFYAPKGFHAFMVLEVSVHVIMAGFSHAALDPAFMLAHIVKLLAYGMWFVSMWFEASHYAEVTVEKIRHEFRDSAEAERAVLAILGR